MSEMAGKKNIGQSIKITLQQPKFPFDLQIISRAGNQKNLYLLKELKTYMVSEPVMNLPKTNKYILLGKIK